MAGGLERRGRRAPGRRVRPARPLRAAAAALALGLGLPGCAAAAGPAPRDAVIEGWLGNDETVALPALAALAAGGDPQARVLLALIDKTAELQGPWLLSQPREARATLLRAPGGRSGTSWMSVAAAAGDPLASAWVALWSVSAGAPVAAEFARLGEGRAAREAVLTLAGRETPGLAVFGESPDFPPSLRYLLLPHGAAAPADWPAGAIGRLMLGEAVAPGDQIAWLLSAPEARPIAALCGDLCPATAGSCALATFHALGNPLAVLTLGSPASSIIPDGRFDHSRRGHSAVLRRILLGWTGRGRDTRMAAIAAEDACLAAALGDEAARTVPK